MAVNQLGRIAFRFTGDGFNAKLVKLSGGLRGEDHMIAQLLKEYGPEGEILVHI